jgi:hypothetical protein
MIWQRIASHCQPAAQAAPVFGGPGGTTDPYQAALELLGLRPSGEPSPPPSRPQTGGATTAAANAAAAQPAQSKAKPSLSRPPQEAGQVLHDA